MLIMIFGPDLPGYLYQTLRNHPISGLFLHYGYIFRPYDLLLVTYLIYLLDPFDLFWDDRISPFMLSFQFRSQLVQFLLELAVYLDQLLNQTVSEGVRGLG